MAPEPSASTDERPLQPPLEIPETEQRDFAQPVSPSQSTRLPTLRSSADAPKATNMTPSSTPLGAVNAARRPPSNARPSASGTNSNESIRDTMRKFLSSRQGTPPNAGLRTPNAGSVPNGQPFSAGTLPRTGLSGQLPPSSPTGTTPIGGPLVGGLAGFRLPPSARPPPQNTISAPAIPNMRMNPKGLAAKRGIGAGLKLSDASGPPKLPTGATGGEEAAKGNDGNANGGNDGKGQSESMFSKYSEFVDTKTGTLNFKGKATIHGKGIDFSSGSSFSISLDEVDTLEELGKGNYGTVYKVRHSRPQMRRPGQGLAGNRQMSNLSLSSNSSSSPATPVSAGSDDSSPMSRSQGSGTTGLIMAMKEIRLELDEAKFAAIIMELDVLHRCISPFIIDFYGAFFQEGAVYICMEFMDGGSMDKLYGDGVPESVLRKVALSTVMGLKNLKDEHEIIHRDVKPTNILVNSRGQVKICDFGVSGNLVASIAKTNIGCQSYMAPERISSGGIAQAGANPGGGTYSVQSDIWSLGLSVVECAMGRYPYPPETYNNIFSQLSAIVDGDPPSLPPTTFSPQAHDFVSSCLHKIPAQRPTYAMLIRHPWLVPLLKPPTITEEDDNDTNEPESPDLASSSSSFASYGASDPATADKEVAAWVRDALEKRRNGTLGKSAKPALHAAPLDAVGSPGLDGDGAGK
ncbi:hypothetical protein MMC20_006339 [Loxospora ochrophaea]|nr:hypothetical protein [Loxospora ochrophaea]